MEDAFLEVLRKTGPERVDLIGAQVTLGRASDNTVTFADDDAVSRRHAVLLRAPAGWTLRDTGSANGTYVNGERLRVDRVLRSGDRVTLGNTQFVFQKDAAVAPPVERPPLRPAGRGPQHGAGEITGIVRSVQKRRGADGHNELLFQLDRFDDAGRPLPAVPVSLSRYRGGPVNDGDEVEITGAWVDGTFRAKAVFSVSTGAEITAGLRWEYVALVGLGTLLLVLLVVIFAMTLGF
ncbi:MAG: FHA domain-containing protein [Actinomycetota bacterium]|nr:FHA domain-containing protein [Actinomycetota bacterium]